ncbi:hypothetical protein JB92DRAFT_2838476 [Gautieria morchelliformis]|nr:hypothetical protein JB92DRAFT_2838476 [Gautieria morchelliformis]
MSTPVHSRPSCPDSHQAPAHLDFNPPNAPCPNILFYGPRTKSPTPSTPLAVIDPVLLAADTHMAALDWQHPWMEPGQAKVIKHGGKQKKAWSPLGRELDGDPEGFTALSGKLDAVQHLKLQAKETRKDQREHVKEAQNRLRVAGEILGASMMHGHKHTTTKRMLPSTPSSDSESTKENTTVDSQADSSSETSKRTRLTSLSRVARLMEKNDEREDRKEQKMEQFHAKLLERHDRVIDIQERTSTALLEILRQGLLN